MASAGGSRQRALIIALCLTAAFVAVEATVGFIAGSLALVSDAGHMLADSAGLLLAYGAATFARRAPDARRTFGYSRIEVLVVPLHVALLSAIAGYIIFESVARFGGTGEVETGPVLVVGVLGLAVNVFVLVVLRGHAHESLNVRGAALEAAADAAGSVAVIVSAGAIALGAWPWLDTVAGLGIAALIAPRAASLLRQAGGILMEGTPPGLELAAISEAAAAVPGVVAMHDVHVWSIAPAFPAMSAHVEIADAGCTEHVLTDLASVLRERFGIGHVTLQPETPSLHAAMECCLSPDSGLIEMDDHAHRPVAP